MFQKLTLKSKILINLISLHLYSHPKATSSKTTKEAKKVQKLISRIVTKTHKTANVFYKLRIFWSLGGRVTSFSSGQRAQIPLQTENPRVNLNDFVILITWGSGFLKRKLNTACWVAVELLKILPDIKSLTILILPFRNEGA